LQRYTKVHEVTLTLLLISDFNNSVSDVLFCYSSTTGKTVHQGHDSKHVYYMTVNKDDL